MQITLPYQFKARNYQLPFLKAMDDGPEHKALKRAVLIWNRRSGKDKTCFNFMVKKAFERVGTYFYFLPSYSQAKKVIWDNIDIDGFKMLDHIPKEVIRNTNATELKIELINGSIIQLMGADEFKKSGVGTNPIGVVFSEYPLNNPEAWNYVSPILAVNGGWAVFNFTPRGMNHGWNVYQQALNNPKWFAELLTVDQTKVLTTEQLEEERLSNPQDFIDQEYYCKFIEGAGAFFRRIDECRYDGVDMKPESNHRYQMGIDLAKHQDYTVLTILDLMTFKVIEQDRFNQIDWPMQKAKIEAMYLRYFKPSIYMDSTGIGDPILDDLLHKGINVYSYKFTEQSRKDLLTNLQLLLEQNRIKYPETLETLISELKSFRYEISGERGKTRIQVPDGLHDDTVMSLALACWQIPQNPLPLPTSIRLLNRTAEENRPNQNEYE